MQGKWTTQKEPSADTANMNAAMFENAVFSTDSLSGLVSSQGHNLGDNIVVSETKFLQGRIHWLTAEWPGRGCPVGGKSLRCPWRVNLSCTLLPSCCLSLYTGNLTPHPPQPGSATSYSSVMRGPVDHATVKNLRGTKPVVRAHTAWLHCDELFRSGKFVKLDYCCLSWRNWVGLFLGGIRGMKLLKSWIPWWHTIMWTCQSSQNCSLYMREWGVLSQYS